MSIREAMMEIERREEHDEVPVEKALKRLVTGAA